MFFENSNSQCPICHAERPSVLCPVVLAGTAPVYELEECPDCRTRFLNPLPTTEELHRFYAPNYYGSDWYKQEGKGRVFGRAMLPRSSPRKFLDVGCSLGFFIDGIRRSSSWEVYGVEVSPEAVAFARDKLNLDVRCGELSSASYPDQFFDYIHVSNVLEHVCDPIGFLKECRRVLRPGGKLHLCVPNGPVNSASLIKYYKSEGSPARSKDGHLFFFSQDALRKIFRESDLQIYSSRTYGIRRGLRAIGCYPQRPGWKKHYRPHSGASTETQMAIQLPNRKKRLPGYYFYRFWQARLKMLPGLWSIGLDFEIILGTGTAKPLVL
jgi:SAM-dependent methyltransferase